MDCFTFICKSLIVMEMDKNITEVYLHLFTISLVAQLVKNSPAVLEIWVQSLGWEDPLEKGKSTYSSILAWRIPLTP